MDAAARSSLADWSQLPLFPGVDFGVCPVTGKRGRVRRKRTPAPEQLRLALEGDGHG